MSLERLEPYITAAMEAKDVCVGDVVCISLQYGDTTATNTGAIDVC